MLIDPEKVQRRPKWNEGDMSQWTSREDELQHIHDPNTRIKPILAPEYLTGAQPHFNTLVTLLQRLLCSGSRWERAGVLIAKP